MKVRLITLAKNENRYLEEFLRHYDRLGFDDAVIMDNNEPDGERVDDAIPEAMDMGVHVVDGRCRKTNAEELSRKHESFIRDQYQKASADGFDWVFIADVDEYLSGVENVKEWLSDAKFRKADGIAIRWRVFDDNGLLDTDGDYRVVKRFTRKMVETPRNEYINRLKKMFVRTNLKGDVNVHEHGASGHVRIVDVCGSPYHGDAVSFKRGMLPDPACENVRVDHYKCMTVGEYFRKKMSTFSNAKVYNTVEAFFKVNEDTPEKRSYFAKLMSSGANQ